MEKWNGKYKAFTLSYDDGVTSDRKLVEIFNKYGLKCTFNLNSGNFDEEHGWMCGDMEVKRLASAEVKDLYAGHEIAVHGLKHIGPTGISQEEFDEEFLTDRENLTRIFGKQPVGMAYAYGSYDDELVERLAKVGFKYGRTVWDSLNFDIQTDLLRFRPTCHHENEQLFELLQKFIDMPADPENPQLFYLWGHSYEFASNDNWDRIEKVCQMICGRDDIFCGTNSEVLL